MRRGGGGPGRPRRPHPVDLLVFPPPKPPPGSPPPPRGRPPPLVGVDFPVRQQVQILIEHLPVQLRARQATPATLAENAQHHCGFLHCASLMAASRSIACAPSPCGPALAVSRLAGRHPGDYCGHSVTRPGGRVIPRSHCRTYLARLRRPVRLLQYPTGHRSRALEDCREYMDTPRQGPAPVTGVFPAGVDLRLLETGI